MTTLAMCILHCTGGSNHDNWGEKNETESTEIGNEEMKLLTNDMIL